MTDPETPPNPDDARQETIRGLSGKLVEARAEIAWLGLHTEEKADV